MPRLKPCSDPDFPERTRALRSALALEAREGVTQASMSALVRAADALHRSDDPGALRALLTAYNRARGDWGRVRLLRSLVSLGRPAEVRPVLLAAAGDPVWRLRMLAARALCDEGPLLLLTCDSQWRVREAACRALGRQPPSEATLDALGAALNDEDARVAAAAERALDRARRR